MLEIHQLLERIGTRQYIEAEILNHCVAPFDKSNNEFF